MKTKQTKNERREQKKRNQRKMKVQGASVKKLRQLSMQELPRNFQTPSSNDQFPTFS